MRVLPLFMIGSALAGCAVPTPRPQAGWAGQRLVCGTSRYGPGQSCFYAEVPVPTAAWSAPVPPDHSGLTVEERQREASQGRVRRMSLDRCERLTMAAPGEAAPLGPSWRPGEPSPPNPYYTPQENYCMAMERQQESPANNGFPGLLPEGATAVSLGNGAWQVTR